MKLNDPGPSSAAERTEKPHASEPAGVEYPAACSADHPDPLVREAAAPSTDLLSAFAPAEREGAGLTNDDPTPPPQIPLDRAHLQRMVERLEKLEASLATLDRRSASESQRLSAFPMGPGSGNAGARKQHYRSMDSAITRATEAGRLRREVARLRGEIEGYKEGRIDERGRTIRPIHELQAMVVTTQRALESGILAGKPISPEDKHNLKAVLKGFQADLTKAERREARFAGVSQWRQACEEVVRLESSPDERDDATASWTYEEPLTTDLQVLEKTPEIDLKVVCDLLGIHKQEPDLRLVAERIAELKLVAGELRFALQGTTAGLEDHVKQDAAREGVKPEQLCPCATHELKWAKEALGLAKQTFPDLRPAVLRRS